MWNCAEHRHASTASRRSALLIFIVRSFLRGLSRTASAA